MDTKELINKMYSCTYLDTLICPYKDKMKLEISPTKNGGEFVKNLPEYDEYNAGFCTNCSKYKKYKSQT